MSPIPLEIIRKVASHHRYQEIQFNEKSRIISFRNDTASTRINVYYTTGTIATCIDHPSKGKTQLFRRDQTTDCLQQIFSNPRIHTGVGYYRRIAEDSDRRHDKYCDDAERWYYVQGVTNFCSYQQAAQIAAACKVWNGLRFAPGKTSWEEREELDPAIKEYLPDFCPDNCGKCGQDRAGSWCSLGRILCKVAKKTDTIPLLVLNRSEDNCGNTNQENKSNQELDNILVPSDDGSIVADWCMEECKCEEGEKFSNWYASKLVKLERSLMSFPKIIRRELIYFFSKKLQHSHDLIVIKSVGDHGTEPEINSYAAQYLSNEILRTNWDYGDLTYNTNDSNQAKLCLCNACGRA